ncbi:MAG: GEVED domain-containing protein [Flavobacteriales bacterium]|nr:MAG: GEVED domain-containing protein [Flavobacteriales bacterium]
MGLLALSSQAQTFSIVGTGTAANTATGYPAPFGQYYWGARHQFFVPAAQMAAAGIAAGSQVQSIGFNVTALNGTAAHTGWQIRVFNVGANANPISAGYVTTGQIANTVATTYTPVVGWNQFSFVAPFVWNGTDNLVIETCFNNAGFSNNASTQWTNTLAGATYSRWYRADASGVCASTLSTSTSATTRPNMRFGWQSSVACNGIPAPGNTLASVSTACAGAAFNLSLQNSSLGTGITYAWQRSTDGGGSWNPFGTNAGTQSISLTQTTQYRCLVTCTNGGQSATSAPVTVTLNTSACDCVTYPASNATNTADTKIDSVKVNGVGFGSLATTCETYTFTSGTGLSLQQGTTATVRIRNGSCSGFHYTAYYSLFADFNGDGDFADAGETLAQGGPTSQLNGITDMNISVPPTASLGAVRFRAIVAEAGAPPAATGTYAYGETEDFCVTILPLPPCTDPPSPGVTLTSNASPCGNSSFTLSMSTPPLGTGLTYEWQRSDDGFSTFTVLGTGLTQSASQAFGATWEYRCVVSCSGNPGVASTPVSVTTSTTPVAICGTYCTPTSTSGCSFGDLIARVQLNTLDNNSGTACVSFYNDYTGNPLLTTNLQAGTSYNCIISSGAYSQAYAVWIDYNDDGIFDNPGERVGFTATPVPANSSASFPISLSCSPPVGAHRMRVRSAWDVTVPGPSITPCGAPGDYGEVEDYVITIDPPPPCPQPNTLAVNVTSGTSATFTWNAGCTETVWDAHVQLAGGGTPVTPSNPGITGTPTLTRNDLSVGNWEFWVRADCGVNGPSAWVGPFTFTIIANDNCASPTPITVDPFGACVGIAGTTVGATAGDSPYPSCLVTGLVDVWYSFNSGSNSVINWQYTLGTMTVRAVQVLTACGGSEVYCVGDVDAGQFAVTPNTNYLFRVLTFAGTAGTFNLCLTGPPANDLCAGAIPVSCGTPVSGTTAGATNQGAPAGCVDAVGTAPGVWYSISGQCGNLTASLCTGTAFDSRLAVLSGACGTLTCIASNDNGCGLQSTVNFTASADQTYYIYVTGTGTASGAYTLEVTGCQQAATATASVVDNCPSNQFSVDVNLTSLGSGGSATIEYSVNGGSPIGQAAGLGSNIIGPFATTDAVSVTVDNGTVCDLELGNYFSGCPVEIVCGSTLTVSHCYSNNDPRTFTFTSDNPLETVTVTFVEGTMDPNDVIRAYSGTDNQGPPIPQLTGSFANLFGVSGSSDFGYNSIFIEIDSDGSNSCADGNQDTWVFEVECTPFCVDPDGTATFDVCASTIDVQINFTGDAPTCGVRYIVNGGTPVDQGGFVDFDQVTIGPFTPGDQVQVLLLHEGFPPDALCNRNLGTFTILPVPTPPAISISATPSTVCVGGTSQLSVYASAPGPIGSYAFETNTNGGLLPMTSPVTIQGTNLDDTGGPLTAIGFPMTYGTNSYTQFSTNSNGLMRLGNTAISGSRFNSPLTSATDLPLLAPWWDDLHTGSDGYVRTSLEGTAGSYVRIVEWFVRPFGAGTAATMRFQVALYQASGAIEFRYSPTGAAYVDGASIAITGGNTSSRVAVNSVDHTASPTILYDALTAWPGGTRLYRFLAPQPPGVTYTWSPADDLDDPNSATPIASNITETTTYTASVFFGGCPTDVTVDVTVEPALTSASITPSSGTICTGTNAVTLTANAGDGVPPFTYAWTDPNNQPAGTSQTVDANLGGTWTCLVTDACNGSFLASATITAVAPPTVNITATAPICAGGSVTLSANATNATNVLWGGAAPVGGSTTADVTISGLSGANNGTYTVTASNEGCTTAPASYVLAVNPNPSITSTTAVPATVCTGGTSQLDVAAAPPALQLVLNGTGFWMDELSWTLTNSLNAIVGSGGGYGNNQIITVPLGALTNGPFTFSVETQGTFNDNQSTYTLTCGGSTILTGTVFGGQTFSQGGLVCEGSFTYAWSPATFLSGTAISNPVASGVTSETPYSVLVTNTSTGCSSTGNVTVGMYPVPTLDCGTYPTLCAADAPIALTGSPAGGTWSGTGVTGSSFNPAVGTQTLTYSYTYGAGCVATCQVTITVLSADTDGDNIPDCADECPTLFGEIGDPCDAGPGFILGQIDGDCNCIGVACTEDVRLEVKTDANGSHTSWEIREATTSLLVCSGGPYTGINDATITTDCCLPAACYVLRVFDSAGDGIVGGGYVLREAGGNQRRIIDNRGNFTTGSISQINDASSFCVPMGDDRLVFTSCDKLDWKTSPCGGEFVVANDNSAVSAQYGVNNANSGYQMWWFDPNGGFSFRRFQSHNTANGLPASATRACHFQINSWSGNQLQQGVMYNVRVRGRINGVYNEWGPACRLMVDNVAAQCPRTKLMDIPDNQFLSCGQFRPVGTGQASLVHARPVRRMNNNCNWVSANRYQFRFRIPAENIVVVKTSQTGQYWVNTNGLACDKTYEVDVRASFNNGATWCTVTPDPNNVEDPAWGDVCLLTTTCAIQSMALQGGSSPDGAALRMFPNPNRGDQVMISLDHVAEEVTTVSVDIFDAFGKRVVARTIAVQDGYMNTLFDLNGALANGLYMVNITAGAETYTERLVIQK